MASMTQNTVAIELLEELLQLEYLQRDIYETYGYYLSGLESPAIHGHLKVHLAEEQLHIDILTRYLMGYGAAPMLKRKPIPDIQPVSLSGILDANFTLEKEAVEKYSNAIHTLETDVKHTALRVDLEDILKQEQEHTHDLIQWLNRWRDERTT